MSDRAGIEAEFFRFWGEREVPEKTKERVRGEVHALSHAQLMRIELLRCIDRAFFFGLARGWDLPPQLLSHLPADAARHIYGFRLPNIVASGEFLEALVTQRLSEMEEQARRDNPLAAEIDALPPRIEVEIVPDRQPQPGSAPEPVAVPSPRPMPYPMP